MKKDDLINDQMEQPCCSNENVKEHSPFLQSVANFFGFARKNTNFTKETIGGIVTFLAMCYILAVNPTILSKAGMPIGGVFVATALVAGLSTIVMGLFAKLPLALAPGMGLNAFFTFTVVIGNGYTWQEALAAGVIAGLLFFILSITKLRTIIMNAIPKDLRLAFGAGIGLFIAFIGLKNAGLIVASPATFVTLTDFRSPTSWLGLFGIMLIFVLHVAKVRFSLIISIVVTTIVGLSFGAIFPSSGLPTFELGKYSDLKSFTETATGFIKGFSSAGLWRWSLIMVIISFTFTDLFDTMGTFLAVAGPAGLVREDGSIENAERGLLIDSGATVVGNLLGTPVVTTYIESGTGIAAGARTGFSSLVTGLLFLLMLPAYPIISLITHEVFTSMALVYVGLLMCTQLKDINWTEPAIAASCFVSFIIMPLTYSISNGIAFGIITYVITKLASRKFRDIHPMMYVLCVIFSGYYIATAITGI